MTTKCRACGHEEAHDASAGSGRQAYCRATRCVCSETTRQIAALRAGLEDAEKSCTAFFAPDDPTLTDAILALAEIRARIKAALKEAHSE